MKYIDMLTITLSNICANSKCDTCALRFEHNNAVCIYTILALNSDRPQVILKRLYEDIKYYDKEEDNEKI